jgi:hypothetical protein
MSELYVNDYIDDTSPVIKYMSRNITAAELMNILDEIFERFPFAKSFPICLTTKGAASEVELNKEKGVIFIS